MNASNNSKFPLVVIVGGGFGGLQVAKQLKDKPVDVLMLDKHNYHTFQPLLYQVAMGSLESESIAFSLRKNFASQKNFRFRIAEVTKVDAETNTLETTIGNIAYDYLVIATGSTTNFFGNKDIEHYSMPMKSIPEALNLRYSILQNIEEALLKVG
jgi:NADH dehydrogenase